MGYRSLLIFSSILILPAVFGSGYRTAWRTANKILPGSIVSKGGIGEEWTHKVKLDDVNDVRIKWKNSYDEFGSLWIIMQVSARTEGYIGIGFSPIGSMTNADMVIGWVDRQGQSHLKDFYGVENGMPLLDSNQDYILLSGHEDDGWTMITFKRKWDTCDDEHDMVLQKDTTRLIWSIGKADPVWDTNGEKPKQLLYHGINRGVQSVFLYDDVKAHNFPNAGDKDIKIWDMTMKNVQVSAVNTTYHCKIEKFTDTSKKHHLIGWEPIIQPENIRNVHHILMYECNIPSNLEGDFDHYTTNHEGGTCYTKNMPTLWGKQCTGFLLVWTVGGEGEMLPSHVGAPLGQEHGGGTYFMVEMHYENPEGKRFVDSSGIRVYYTEKLRENEGAVLLLGYRHSPFMLIPPKQENFMINGICSRECLEKTLPKEGIKVVTTFIHAHLWGTKLRLRHFRNGTELPLICEENHYDFNYQQSRMLRKEITILPGDELLTECQYDTKDMREPVLGGLSTDQEMCQTFFFYYPRIEIGQCTSQSEFYDFMRGLGIQKNVSGDVLKAIHMPYEPKGVYDISDTAKEVETYGQGLSYKGLFDLIEIQGQGISVAEHMRRTNWEDKKAADAVEKRWRDGKHYQFCTTGDSRRIPLQNHIVNYPRIVNPLKHEEKKRMCQGMSAASNKGGLSYALIIMAIFMKWIMHS